jgi:hypothetical protein
MTKIRGGTGREEGVCRRPECGKTAARSCHKGAFWTGSMGVIPIVFLPLNLPDMWSISILLFSKIVTECGGVTEGHNDTSASVSCLETRVYERFSMRGLTQFS